MASKKSGVSIEKIIDDICQITGVQKSRLMESIRGPGGNPERRFAVWAMQTSTYLTYREIGEQLNMTVEHVARDIRRKRTVFERFDDWTSEWLDKLSR